MIERVGSNLAKVRYNILSLYSYLMPLSSPREVLSQIMQDGENSGLWTRHDIVSLSNEQALQPIEYRDIRLNPMSREVKVGDYKPTILRPIQSIILFLLMTKPEEVVTRQEIHQALSRGEYLLEDSLIDTYKVHVYNLRHAIHDEEIIDVQKPKCIYYNGKYIQTIRGQGWKLRQ